MKRLRYKKPFNGFGNAINLIPESFKIEGVEFELTDSIETYNIKWSDNKPNIISASGNKMVTEDLARLKQLMNYKPDSNLGLVKGDNRLIEDVVFTKSLLKEDNGYGKTKSGEVKPMSMDKAINNFLNNPKHNSPKENKKASGEEYKTGEFDDDVKTESEEPETSNFKLSPENEVKLKELLKSKAQNLKDTDIHKFSEDNGLNTPDVEAWIYKIAAESLNKDNQ